MRNRDPFGQRREIMIQHFNRFSRIDLTRAIQVTDQLLFLGIHADHGIAFSLITFFQLGNPFKLRITVYMVASRLFFNALRFT